MLRSLLLVLLFLSALAWAADRARQRRLPELEPTAGHTAVGVFHLTSAAPRAGLAGLEEVARQARDAGLRFVVVTDPEQQLAAPIVRDDVVILSYAELTTPFGRLVQLGSGYVLPREERQRISVHDSIRALGGVPIISHPTDRKRPWTGPLTGAGGVEIASIVASARRVAGPLSLGVAPLLLAGQLNPTLAVAQLYDRDDEALARWDDNPDPRFIGLCGVDNVGHLPAHLNLRTWRIVLEEPLPDDPSQWATAVIESISSGRFYCAAGSFGDRPFLRFGARRFGEWVAHAGDATPAADVQEIVALGPGTSDQAPHLVLLRNGEEVTRVVGRELRYADPLPGTYRVEVRVPVPGLLYDTRLVPVLYSNRIRLLGPPSPGSSEG